MLINPGADEMDDEDEIKEQVISELVEIRQRIADLEILDVKRKHAEKCWAEVMALLIGTLSAKKE